MTVELPDQIAAQLHLDGPQAQRRALTALALDGYRLGDLSRGQVSEILGLSFWETAELLKKHGSGIGSNMTFEEYEHDYERARALLNR